MALALVTPEELQALVERALQPLREELAKLRAVVEGEGVSVPEAARRLDEAEAAIAAAVTSPERRRAWHIWFAARQEIRAARRAQ